MNPKQSATRSRAGVIAGLVLAAGAGGRFGGPKQLAPFEGQPLVQHALAAIAASSVDRVVVVLGAHADRILAEVDLHGAQPVRCESWDGGQARSLAAGIQAVAYADAVVVTLGDQPLISPRAIDRVISARGATVAARATYGGTPGHPVLLERELFDSVSGLEGDAGARQLFAGRRVCEVPCDDLGSNADVDTVEQLAALSEEAATGGDKRDRGPGVVSDRA